MSTPELSGITAIVRQLWNLDMVKGFCFGEGFDFEIRKISRSYCFIAQSVRICDPHFT